MKIPIAPRFCEVSKAAAGIVIKLRGFLACLFFLLVLVWCGVVLVLDF